MRFTEEAFLEFFDSLSDTVDFILTSLFSIFEKVVSYPILAWAFFVPTGLILIYLSWEFILWASDIHIHKDNIGSLTNKAINEHKRILRQQKRDEESQNRFMANYELRHDYYTANLMNQAARLDENKQYHASILEENKRYHDEIISSKKGKPSNNSSFDIEQAKLRSRYRTRDIGNMKTGRRRPVNNSTREEDEQ